MIVDVEPFFISPREMGGPNEMTGKRCLGLCKIYSHYAVHMDLYTFVCTDICPRNLTKNVLIKLPNSQLSTGTLYLRNSIGS
jgi:hypothetical protein